MKVKASITLSNTTVRAIDQLIGKRGNRSAFIEAAIREYITRAERARRDARDIAIINAQGDRPTNEDRELSEDLAYFADLAMKSWDAQERVENATVRKKRPARRRKS